VRDNIREEIGWRSKTNPFGTSEISLPSQKEERNLPPPRLWRVKEERG